MSEVTFKQSTSRQRQQQQQGQYPEAQRVPCHEVRKLLQSPIFVPISVTLLRPCFHSPALPPHPGPCTEHDFKPHSTESSHEYSLPSGYSVDPSHYSSPPSLFRYLSSTDMLTNNHITRSHQQRPLRHHPLRRPRPRRSRRAQGSRPASRRDTQFPNETMCAVLHPRDTVLGADPALRRAVDERHAADRPDACVYGWRDDLSQDGRRCPG